MFSEFCIFVCFRDGIRTSPGPVIHTLLLKTYLRRFPFRLLTAACRSASAFLRFPSFSRKFPTGFPQPGSGFRRTHIRLFIPFDCIIIHEYSRTRVSGVCCRIPPGETVRLRRRVFSTSPCRKLTDPGKEGQTLYFSVIQHRFPPVSSYQMGVDIFCGKPLHRAVHREFSTVFCISVQ